MILVLVYLIIGISLFVKKRVEFGPMPALIFLFDLVITTLLWPLTLLIDLLIEINI